MGATFKNAAATAAALRKSTASKKGTASQIKYVQDDSCLVHEFDANDKMVMTYRENRLLKNLRGKQAANNNNGNSKNHQSVIKIYCFCLKHI